MEYRFRPVEVVAYEVISTACGCLGKTPNAVVDHTNLLTARHAVVGWFDDGRGVAYPGIVLDGVVRIVFMDHRDGEGRSLLLPIGERLASEEATLIHQGMHGKTLG